ncbi:cupredoxin family copper-binding protein [Streptomyces sp. NPDC050433]|uniref:cupredoxin family copper-binding protein n=1 Tax=Streptomyces sp. NPDC050433 TaxID=3365615 RepID=UPI00378BB461
MSTPARRTTPARRSRATVLIRVLLAAQVVAASTLIAAPATPAHAAGYQVAMSGSAFSPRMLTVPAGSTVTWTNRDTAPHDVKNSSGAPAFHSPMLNKGGSWSRTLANGGTYDYLCTVHPGMTGRLIVKAPPAAPTTRPATTAPTHNHETATPAPVTPSRAPGGAPSASSDKSHGAGHASPSSAASGSPSPTTPGENTAQNPDRDPEQDPVSAAGPTEAVGAARPLNPLLLLTGAVAGVSVLCLLLVSSRLAAARPETGDPKGDRA